MITRQEMVIILARCAGHDHRFPQASEAMLLAWLEEWERFPGVNLKDSLDAVGDYYSVAGQSVPLAADILVLARAHCRDRYERSDLDSADRQRLEAQCDAKAGPDQPAIDARQKAIASFAQTFGIGEREAAVRITRERTDSNFIDMREIDVTHRRMEAPPNPIPCPECGALSRCEHDEVEKPPEKGHEDV